MEVNYVLVAVIPLVLFLLLIFYYTILRRGKVVPKIAKTKNTLKIIGVSTLTTDDTFIEDDALLWKEFRRVKEKNLIPKPKDGFSYVLIKMMPINGSISWEYLIGEIVSDFKRVPIGFKPFEIKPQLYAMVQRTFKREIPWINSTLKIEKYLYDKWLPNSKYALNTESTVKTIEYHTKKSGDSNKRNIVFYLAIKRRKEYIFL